MRFVPLQSVEARALGFPESRDLSQLVLVERGRRWGGWRASKRLLFRLPVFYLFVACLFAMAFVAPGPRWTYWILAFAPLLALSPPANAAGDALYRLMARRRRCAGNAARDAISSTGAADSSEIIERTSCPRGLR